MGKKVTAQLDAVKVAASIVVAGGGLFALYLATRRQQTQESELKARHAELAQRDRVQAHTEQVAEANRVHAERVADDNRADAEARRVTDLFAKSVEQLGSDKAPVRLGGLYALERLAQDNSHQRQTVVNVLCAYLRMPYTLPGDSDADNTDEQTRIRHDERVQEREVRLTAQRVLSAHLRPGDDSSKPVGTFWEETDLDLAGATLVDFDLAHCKLRRVKFDRASFFGETSFNNVVFEGTALFDDAIFNDLVSFSEAKFVGVAGFACAAFDVVGLKKARFGHVAMFGSATFSEGVRFDEVIFESDAWFRDAIFLGYVKFNRVSFGRFVEFGAVTFRNSIEFDASVVRHRVPARSSWPEKWRPSEQHGPIEGREGTWHDLVIVDTDTSGDDHNGQVSPS
ncbi:pentapeptide repeat-containing protein [Umezawaea sp. Da 62-37]|uniref:pentapeptide repeat-containing protein n=1 Tax=Umezawaea sp. Da 62-37 TaxID=3075927 RepID=UPI0028F7084B|nr:pentapeptide repeat-containing protein [Umezawaea sp. Da 62-37]WNV83699.1 pentapeptide repeat-containing protein [Umezawaea sp. Da 62-37]